MNILLVSAELAPFAKVGGLADISSALPIGWKRIGHQPIIVIPKYKGIADNFHINKTDITLTFTLFGKDRSFSVWISTLPNEDIPVYFIESDELYDRPGIYGNPDGYIDNDERFFVLSKCALELMIQLNIKPDIISAHDYHTALLLPLLKFNYSKHPLFQSCKGVLTIHNAQYQGWYDLNRMIEMTSWNIDNCMYNGSFNALKSGIEYADLIIAVSPSYAKEILTPEFGEGLENIYDQYSDKLIGILNGVDYSSWNPESDTCIEYHFSKDDYSRKSIGKNLLIKNTFSDYSNSHSLPLIGMVSRFTDQKGIDLLDGCIEHILEQGICRFIVLGSGEDSYQSYFRTLEKKYPSFVSFTQGYNDNLAHHILAYSDFFLLPSRFEPCGLTQLYALKYGTVPIVRSVGGLKDSVQSFDPISQLGDGIIFHQFTKEALHNALMEALILYNNSTLMHAIIHNGMNADFSIEKTAKEYINEFKKLVSKH
jgi:starch synthase